jgi:hypothetical protein
MEELLAVMAVAGAVFYCSFGTFRAFVTRRSSWLGRPLFGLASTRCSSGQWPKARPTIPAQPPKSSGRPTGKRPSGLPNSYSSNAERRPSTKRTLAGRTRIVGQRPPGSPVRASEQSASRPRRRWGSPPLAIIC